MTIPLQQQANLVNLIPPGKLYYEYKVYEILAQLNPGASGYDGFIVNFASFLYLVLHLYGTNHIFGYTT